MSYVSRVALRRTPADVAELVDALVSGTSGSNVVGVQVSPSASNQLIKLGSSIRRACRYTVCIFWRLPDKVQCYLLLLIRLPILNNIDGQSYQLGTLTNSLVTVEKS